MASSAIAQPEEEAQNLMDSSSSRKRYKSSRSSGMESSVFRFQNVNFTVGEGDKKRFLLKDVSGKVRFGREY